MSQRVVWMDRELATTAPALVLLGVELGLALEEAGPDDVLIAVVSRDRADAARVADDVGIGAATWLRESGS